MMFVAVVVTKTKPFSRVLTFLKTKTTQLHVDHQQAGFMVNRNRISVMVDPNCINIPKYILIGYISLSNRGWRKIYRFTMI